MRGARGVATVAFCLRWEVAVQFPKGELFLKVFVNTSDSQQLFDSSYSSTSKQLHRPAYSTFLPWLTNSVQDSEMQSNVYCFIFIFILFHIHIILFVFASAARQHARTDNDVQQRA